MKRATCDQLDCRHVWHVCLLGSQSAELGALEYYVGIDGCVQKASALWPAQGK